MNIPGYKWDRERKRYFKVLKTGELPNSNYTVSALANKDRMSKRKLVRQESEDHRENENVLQNHLVLKLGSRSRIWYNGGPTEIISSFTSTPNGVLTGSRDGTLTLGQWKSESGRSIVDICMFRNKPAIAAVDNDAGTFVGCSTASTHLKGQFVTQIQPIEIKTDLNIGIGSQQGLTIWKPESASLNVINSGSVSALSRSEGSVVVTGYRNGAIKLIDLRSRSTPTVGSIGNKKMVTHVANITTRPAILATGLEDQMMLFDIRKAIEPIYQFQGYENWSTNAHGFALSPDNESVAVAMDSGVVDIYDVFSGTLAKTLQQSNKPKNYQRSDLSASAVTCIRWTQDGLFMATGNKVRAFPSMLRKETPVLMSDQVQELAVTHSNINLHEKT